MFYIYVQQKVTRRLHWAVQQFRCRFCKVPPQLCDGSTLIHDICSHSCSRCGSSSCSGSGSGGGGGGAYMPLYWLHTPGLRLDNEVSQSTDQPHGTVCHQHYGHWTCRRAPSSGHWRRTCSRLPGAIEMSWFWRRIWISRLIYLLTYGASVLGICSSGLMTG